MRDFGPSKAPSWWNANSIPGRPGPVFPGGYHAEDAVLFRHEREWRKAHPTRDPFDDGRLRMYVYGLQATLQARQVNPCSKSQSKQPRCQDVLADLRVQFLIRERVRARGRDAQADTGSVISGTSSLSNPRSEQSSRSFGRGPDVYDTGIPLTAEDWAEIDPNKYDNGIPLSSQDWNSLLDTSLPATRGEPESAYYRGRGRDGPSVPPRSRSSHSNDRIRRYEDDRIEREPSRYEQEPSRYRSRKKGRVTDEDYDSYGQEYPSSSKTKHDDYNQYADYYNNYEYDGSVYSGGSYSRALPPRSGGDDVYLDLVKERGSAKKTPVLTSGLEKAMGRLNLLQTRSPKLSAERTVGRPKSNATSPDISPKVSAGRALTAGLTQERKPERTNQNLISSSRSSQTGSSVTIPTKSTSIIPLTRDLTNNVQSANKPQTSATRPALSIDERSSKGNSAATRSVSTTSASTTNQCNKIDSPPTSRTARNSGTATGYLNRTNRRNPEGDLQSQAVGEVRRAERQVRLTPH
ncbi:uncharacterized protein QC763_0114430 [Podospora pseudopauciseta]|uniref:Uncharacterized protein n=1 Tax=Podospora pseudopauciseta TaxID=2093780 RepID=A0ABR0GZW0_9PEZI|nr:hypothetical protein QC763_0114430 [Podospora pseudopauciseta]